MKKVFLLLAVVIAGAGIFELGWISRAGFNQAPSTKPSSAPSVASTTPGNSTTNTPPPAPHFPLVSPDDFQHLRTAREAALRDNPDLAAEYKQIVDDMQ